MAFYYYYSPLQFAYGGGEERESDCICLIRRNGVSNLGFPPVKRKTRFARKEKNLLQ